MKQTEAAGLENEMGFCNGSMLTFVSNNHMASWFVIKDAERGINQFEFPGKSETKTFLSGEMTFWKGYAILSYHSPRFNSFFILNVQKRLHFVFLLLHWIFRLFNKKKFRLYNKI